MFDHLYALNAKTILIGGGSLIFAFVGMYLKWFNHLLSEEADRHGIRNIGIYWSRIDTADRRCPPSLRDAVRKTDRLFILSGGVYFTVVI